LLNRAKLRAIARAAGAQLGPDHDVVEFGPGAALVAGRSAWVLLTADGVAGIESGCGLGAAIIWARRAGTDELHVVAERGAGVMARRAVAFSMPIHVHEISGGDVQEAIPAPFAAAPPPSPDHLELVPVIVAAGADAVVEGGIVLGEVRGLEVCRVVDGAPGAGPRLEVGIGAHDRRAFAMIHGDVPAADALGGVVATVTAVRGPGLPPHPLQRLAAERLLRWRLQQDPASVGLATLHPADPPVPRRNLVERTSCVGTGERPDGATVAVVCSVGVDLDVIPYAADARLAEGGGGEPGVGMGECRRSPEVIVAVPARDALAATRELAGALRHSVTLATVD
jgi:hypothetical protein